MNIHPKVSGAAVGVAVGQLIVSVLQSVHGVHLPPEVAGAIPGVLSLVGGWLAPAPVGELAAPSPAPSSPTPGGTA